ncbi:UDP-N-acetylmuramoylalanine--D-glutamate ligase [Dissulfurispira thermophila]|uniref:UDP-N-acetylmuramoylalanine--D-glutamate ligase n=1 Tax=Dissulfurispira thermophila TaxID=2715679 RepID=A0A7G1H1K5_9BACT|nr:UDP-N-acetylmuramoyl-L-alanine--D-glutamate ligase [Dissulfurispira thermophila]BCB95856.1 UDP-N-acetylmuramoylalanine--D-glutamate ligase [Dissulfurispira thermophila]
MIDVKGKKITIVGLARSGVGAANLLCKLGALVTVTDKKNIEELEPYLKRLSSDIRLQLGNHPVELFEQSDIIVVSPGVPLNTAPLMAASEKGIKIIGELELAYQIVNSLPLIVSSSDEFGIHKPSFLAVTGTNGKSTTTALLYEILKNSDFNVVVGGNIGNALTEEISNLRFKISDLNYIVAEVSSFQLESIDTFRPKGAAILNITPDHLDRYHTMADYIDAKCRIFMNQSAGDFLILNADDPTTEEIQKIGNRQWAMDNRPEIFYFSRKRGVKGAYCKDGVIYFNLPGLTSDFCLLTSDFKIKGVHNIENAMAASLMALLSGCSIDAVAGALKVFSGLEHRLEFVREIDNVKFINDSKGTNVGAVVKSLESFNEPIVLIAGGRDKDGDFAILRPIIKEKVKALILIGEAKDKIKKAVGDVIKDVFIEDDFKTAIIKAKQVASSGDVVLLSPACASFDMFRDFEDRGRQFKRVVMEL